MIRGVVILVLVCVCVSSVSAEDPKIGTVSIRLSAPPGYCELNASNAADARMMSAVEGMLGKMGNNLLSLSADCGQLAEWRAGK